MSITKLAAGLMTMEDTRVNLVEYLASDFCINGVPEDDVEFCDVSKDDIYVDSHEHVSNIAEIRENGDA